MQLNPAEISELIKSRIEGLGASSDVRNQGTVVSVTDGIVRVHGLSDVMQGEMLEFPSPGEAREALLATWPQTRGKWYHAAGRACSAAMEGRASVHVARRIFLEAAQESRLTP